MKSIKYFGLFKSAEGHEYSLEAYCDGFIQAFILLTAQAIHLGKHYQLYSIKDEKENLVFVDSIIKLSAILNHF